MAKDGARIHAMKMGVPQPGGLAGAMNMAWTGGRPLRNGPARLIPVGTNEDSKRGAL
jgi:hypothetical protein